MNAVVALCRFCEVHGASVILSTMPTDNARTTDNGVGPSASSWRENHQAEDLIKKLSDFDPLSSLRKDMLEQMIENNCKACSFQSPSENGLVSHDAALEVSYVSVNNPCNPHLYALLKNACKKSLSVSEGELTPIYFGDHEKTGHVFSYPFKLHNSQSRGQTDLFSILVLTADKLFLFNIWPFLTLNVGTIINRLKSAAENVFAKESSSASSSSHYHAHRVSTPPASRSGHSTPEARGRRQKRQMNSDMRSLSDLTNNEQIFYEIHAWFTWLLRAAGRRWAPLASNLLPPQNEDALVIEEEREANEYAFGIPEGVSVLTQQALVTPMEEVLRVSDAQVLGYRLLLRLFDQLPRSQFCRLVHNLVVGNQILIHADSARGEIGPLMLTGLASLLPRGCVKKIVNTASHVPPFQYNLVLFEPAVQPTVPESHSRLLLLLVQVPKGSSSESDFATRWTLKQPQDEVEQLIDHATFNLLQAGDFGLDSAPLVRQLSDGQLCETASDALELGVWFSDPPSAACKHSKIVDEYINLLDLRPALPAKALRLAIMDIKETWINRARVTFSFKLCQAPTLINADAQQRWVNVWESIHCSQKEDEAVVKHWQSALSNASRKNVCHLRNQRTSTSRRASRTSSGTSYAGDSATTLVTRPNISNLN